eukprot:scaffold36003_cov129-Isochrysis_galbana.AAC.1
MLRRGYVRVLQAPMDRDGAKAFLALSYEQFVEVRGDGKHGPVELDEFERHKEVVRRLDPTRLKPPQWKYPTERPP